MRSVAAFLVTLALLLIVSSLFTEQYNAGCVSKSQVHIPPGGVLLTNGLRESDAVALKLRLIEQIKRPQLGIFGNHVVERMTSDDVAPLGNVTFFNYSVPHATLDEMIDLLAYVEDHDKMPRLVLMGITDPNHGEGENILGYQWRMNSEVYMSTGSFLSHSPGQIVNLMIQKFNRWFVDHVDFQSLLRGFGNAALNACGRENAYFDPSSHKVLAGAATGSESGRLAGISALLPKSLSALLAARVAGDGREFTGWMADGSVYTTVEKPLEPYTVDFNERNLLKADDAGRIAQALRKQAAIVHRAGAEIVFFVVPRLDRGTETAASRIMAQALRLVPELHVIDTHGQSTTPSNFVDPAHPSGTFFRSLLQQCIQAGWVNSIAEH